MLNDLEFRVWSQYELSADDFGVMRFSVLQIQNDHAALARRPQKAIKAALETLLRVGLVVGFTHQGQPFICQLDWQDYQKKKYTKHTLLPKPPGDIIARCTPRTKHLFGFHPGGCSIPQFSESSKKVPEIVSEGLRNISPSRETLTLTPHTHANTNTNANTESERLDEAWEAFCNAYPQNRVERGRIVQDGFLAACQSVGVHGVMERLEAHKRSVQWRKGMVPRMGNYFGDKALWRQELPEHEGIEDAGRTGMLRNATAEFLK